jgi:prevent-host-death family protein
MRTVGAYEAKTHLPKLLAAVEGGETIVITRHGKEVARLVPPAGRKSEAELAEVVAKWREARKGITLGGLKIRDLIDEGRR